MNAALTGVGGEVGFAGLTAGAAGFSGVKRHDVKFNYKPLGFLGIPPSVPSNREIGTPDRNRLQTYTWIVFCIRKDFNFRLAKIYRLIKRKCLKNREE